MFLFWTVFLHLAIINFVSRSSHLVLADQIFYNPMDLWRMPSFVACQDPFVWMKQIILSSQTFCVVSLFHILISSRWNALVNCVQAVFRSSTGISYKSALLLFFILWISSRSSTSIGGGIYSFLLKSVRGSLLQRSLCFDRFLEICWRTPATGFDLLPSLF